jgi:ATP:cob(I)alamin adenosyltransferase
MYNYYNHFYLDSTTIGETRLINLDDFIESPVIDTIVMLTTTILAVSTILVGIFSLALLFHTKRTNSNVKLAIGERGWAKKSIIYTKTGDNGVSSLYNGSRVDKADIVFEALGDVDELNAAIGVSREYCMRENNGLQDILDDIQSRLFDIGSLVATPRAESSDKKIAQTTLDRDTILGRLENAIDTLDEQLTPLCVFILPSGGLAATSLHMARTICRRAERKVVRLHTERRDVQEVVQYLNRLSDFLFVAARYASKMEGRQETAWKKMKK